MRAAEAETSVSVTAREQHKANRRRVTTASGTRKSTHAALCPKSNQSSPEIRARVSLSERGSPRLVENTRCNPTDSVVARAPATSEMRAAKGDACNAACIAGASGMREREREREGRARDRYMHARGREERTASKAAHDGATARRGKGKQSDIEERKPRRGWRRSIGRESDGRRKRRVLERVRRVCKRRAARGKGGRLHGADISR